MLEEFGLTGNEEAIYLSLLKEGSATTGRITAMTGIHRRNVYDSIERLLKKGLVGYVHKGQYRHFIAVDPKQFKVILEKERERIAEKEKKLSKILPKLSSAQSMARAFQRVSVLEGVKGLKTVLDDVIKTGKENLVLSTTELSLIKDYLARFHRRRVKAGVVDRILMNRVEAVRAKRLSRMKHTCVRVMDREFDSPIAVNIYADKVGILIISGSPLAILIEDKDVNRSFRKYFRLLWDSADSV